MTNLIPPFQFYSIILIVVFKTDSQLSSVSIKIILMIETTQ